MSDVFELFGATKAVDSVVGPPPPTMPLLPEDPRERFRVLRTYRTGLKSMTWIEDLQRQLDAEVATEMAAVALGSAPVKGKKKKAMQPIEVLGEERYTEIRDKYVQVVNQMLTLRKEESDRVENLLCEVADTIAVTPGDTWVKREEVSSTTYSTQGLGARTYARASADQKAQHYAIAGLPTEIRTRRIADEHPGDAFWAKSDLTYFEVWVQASEEDCEIAKFKPGLSLKDWLQWCWDRAINPRVMIPGLAWGLEEKLGVTIGRGRSIQGV